MPRQDDPLLFSRSLNDGCVRRVLQADLTQMNRVQREGRRVKRPALRAVPGVDGLPDDKHPHGRGCCRRRWRARRISSRLASLLVLSERSPALPM